MDQPRLVISSTRYEFPHGHYSSSEYKSSILDCGNILHCPMQNSHKKMDELQKENFNLKLRLFLLEDAQRNQLKAKSGFENEQLAKDSIYYKLQTEKLTKDVEEKQTVLRDAFHLIEHLEKLHWETEKSNQQTVNSLRDELQNIKFLMVELRQKLRDKNKTIKNAQFTIENLKKAIEKRKKAQILKLPSKKYTKIYAYNRKILKININSMDVQTNSNIPPLSTKSIEIQCPSVMDLIFQWMVNDNLSEKELMNRTKSETKSNINVHDIKEIACQKCDVDVSLLPNFINGNSNLHFSQCKIEHDSKIQNGIVQNVENEEEKPFVEASTQIPRQSSETIPIAAKPEATNPFSALLLPLGCLFQ